MTPSRRWPSGSSPRSSTSTTLDKVLAQLLELIRQCVASAYPGLPISHQRLPDVATVRRPLAGSCAFHRDCRRSWPTGRRRTRSNIVQVVERRFPFFAEDEQAAASSRCAARWHVHHSVRIVSSASVIAELLQQVRRLPPARGGQLHVPPSRCTPATMRARVRVKHSVIRQAEDSSPQPLHGFARRLHSPMRA